MITTPDLEPLYRSNLGLFIDSQDKVFSSFEKDVLVVGVDRTDKTTYAFSLSMFSFVHNTTLWVKHVVQTSNTEYPQMNQMLIDWDNHHIYAIGTVTSIYFLG